MGNSISGATIDRSVTFSMARYGDSTAPGDERIVWALEKPHAVRRISRCIGRQSVEWLTQGTVNSVKEGMLRLGS